MLTQVGEGLFYSPAVFGVTTANLDFVGDDEVAGLVGRGEA